MPHFVLRQHAEKPPTVCATCSTNRCQETELAPGGFVDTLVDTYMGGIKGRVYLCATCVIAAGKLVGCVAPNVAETMRADIEDLTTRLAAALDEVETEKGAKVISIDDARTLFAEKRSGPKPKVAA